MKEVGNKVLEKLSVLIDNPKSELEYSNPYELLIAVMLSAQCTDKRVNIITRELFKVYKTPFQFANLEVEELEKYIKSCNYYHTKAKNIINMSRILVEKFNGVVPSLHKDLVSLPGVGNKTANVVQAVAFGDQAFPVDTHILRVSNRLGFCDTKVPDVCESVLKVIFENHKWNDCHHLMLLFGRYYCTARNPKCDGCVLREFCKYILKE